MMRKFTLLLLGAMLVATAVAQRPESTVYKASVAPVIDGQVDDVWAEAEGPLDIAVAGSAVPPTLGDPGETTWQALWTDDGLYVLLRVEDDVFYPAYITGGESWQHDKPEIYIDANYILEDGIGPMDKAGHYQVAPAFEEGLLDGSLLNCGFMGETGDIVDYAFNVADPTYIAEYFVPFESLLSAEGFAIDITEKIGFDVTILDRDPDDAGERTAVWVNAGANGSSWTNMDDCGIIIFDGAEPGIYIDDISLTGGGITENNGTLQIEAAILPEDATTKSLLWSVVNGTGKASVDVNGVVTGIIDGDVTVIAAAKDGSYEEASTTVTITNQIVSLGEINLIRNGFFDDKNAEGVADVWSGNFNVVDGALYIPAPDSTRNWWEGDAISGQSNNVLNATDEYTFSFVAWSESPDTFYVDFEDPANGYNRFGNSTHEFATNVSDASADGSSQWEFVTNTEATYYLIDEALVFERWMENTEERFNLMGGKHEDGGVYIDSVLLINNNDKDLLTPGYIPVKEIVVSGGDAVEVDGTLQFAAAAAPSNATLTEVRWSVVYGTGEATIDAAGMLTGVANGIVTVVATAKDDSGVTGIMDVTVGAVGISQQSVETLRVYPNPAVNELNVVLTSENTRVSIYNGVGQKLDEVVVSGTQYKFDISSYAAGIYFVKTDHAVARFVK
jgi:hypothetical protein